MATRTNGLPNVVIFISDQQRADSMPGTCPAPSVRLPHLRWLAEQGTQFRWAYCTTPLCTPARVSLLSGLYPHTTGTVTNHAVHDGRPEPALPSEVRLLPDYLNPLGYASAYVGKWHLGSGNDWRGFTAYTSRTGMHDVFPPRENEFEEFCNRLGIHVPVSNIRKFDPENYDPRLRTALYSTS